MEINIILINFFFNSIRRAQIQFNGSKMIEILKGVMWYKAYSSFWLDGYRQKFTGV